MQSNVREEIAGPVVESLPIEIAKACVAAMDRNSAAIIEIADAIAGKTVSRGPNLTELMEEFLAMRQLEPLNPLEQGIYQALGEAIKNKLCQI